MSEFLEDEGDVRIDCQNCGCEIDEEQYNRTGTDEFCEDCPELGCADPRGHTFGNCECYMDDE